METVVFLREILKEFSDEEVRIVGKTDSKTIERDIVSTKREVIKD